MRKRIVAIAGAVLVGVAALTIGAKPTYAPKNTSVPVVTGSTIVGQQLACSQGTWTRNPSGYAYSWENSPDGSTWSVIGGATSTPYTLVGGDETKTVRCRVTASKNQTSGQAVSAPVGPITSGGGGGGDEANIWVDTNGGTCTDGALRAYVDAEACSTLDAANDTCDNGDAVLIKAGSYGAQTMTGSNGRSSICAVDETTGESVSFTGVVQFGTNGGGNTTDHLSLSNMTVGNEVQVWQSGNNIDFLEMSMEGLYIGNGADDVRWVGGENPGCNMSVDAQNCEVTMQGPTNVLIEDVYIHNVNSSDYGASHPDGMHIMGGSAITIRNSKFKDNGVTNIRIQECCGLPAISNVTIENNWFGQSCVALDCVSRNQNAIDLDSCVSVKVRYNSFSDELATGGIQRSGVLFNAGVCTFPAGAEMIGNITMFSGGSCPSWSGSWGYNVWRNQDGFNFSSCQGTDTKVTTDGGYGYVDSANFDFHLSNGSIAEAFGKPTDCETDDIDGEARPQPGATVCDSGSDERE
jgi:hypothetical protein